MVDKEDKIKERNVNDCRTFLSNGGETQTNTEEISNDQEREEDICEESNDQETCIEKSLEEFGQSGLETGAFSPKHKFSTMVADSRAVNSLTVCSHGKIRQDIVNDRENEIMDEEQTEEYEEEVGKKEQEQTEEHEEEVGKKEEEQTEEHEEEIRDLGRK